MHYNLLLIDDDIDDCEFFEIALNLASADFHLTPVNSSIQAMDMLAKGKIMPEIIFLDLNIPLLSGKECLEAIRRTPGLETMPVVIYTTSSYHKDIEETQQMGASHFLSKTADIDRLSVLLKQLLSKIPLPYVLK